MVKDERVSRVGDFTEKVYVFREPWLSFNDFLLFDDCADEQVGFHFGKFDQDLWFVGAGGERISRFLEEMDVVLAVERRGGKDLLFARFVFNGDEVGTELNERFNHNY